jgi:membrane protease YdiL (CAAX protease family)
MIFAQIGVFGIAYLFEGNFDVFSFEPITLLWVSMTPFGAALIILLISVRFLHKIPIKNFFTSKNFFSWKYLLISAAIWFFLAVLSDVFLSFIQKDNYQFAFNAKTFFPFLFSTLLLVPIQITAEESFFRGYLQKGFTRLTKQSWLGVILQAILFGLLHGANTEVSIYGVLTTMPFYIGIGLLLGIITRKYLGLEEALGLHFANNMYASLIVTFSGSSIESPALFLIKNYQPVISLVLFFITGIIYYFLLQYIHSRES